MLIFTSVILQLTGREENAPQEMPSDPHILRTQIRQQEGTIAALTQVRRLGPLLMRITVDVLITAGSYRRTNYLGVI